MWLYIVGDIKTSVMHCLNVSRDTRHFDKKKNQMSAGSVKGCGK